MASHEASSLAYGEKPSPKMDIQPSDQPDSSASASVDSKSSQHGKNLCANKRSTDPTFYLKFMLTYPSAEKTRADFASCGTRFSKRGEPSSALSVWVCLYTHLEVFAIQLDEDYTSRRRIDGKSIPLECSIVGEEFSNVCPASEWYAIRDWLSTQTQSPPPSYLHRYRQVDSLDSCLIHGVDSNRELNYGSYSGSALLGPPPNAATTQQAVIADALSSVGALWFLSLVNVTANAGHGVPLSDQSDATHRITGNYSQPYAAALCLPDQIRNATDQRKLAFPFMFYTNQPNSATRNQTTESPTYPGQVQVIEHPDYSFAQLENTSGDDAGIRLQWIELRDDLFHGSSIGAAIILPQTELGSAQNVVLCNIAAGWSSSSLELETSGRGVGTVQSTIQNKGQFHQPDRPISRTRVPTDEKNDPALGDVFLGQGTPQQPISISENWARYLNPTIKSLNTSLMDVLWQEQLEQGDEGSMRETAENILVFLTVNGLARTSWGSRLQGELKTLGPNGNMGLDGNYWLQTKGDVFEVDPTKSRDWITLRVDSTLRGYGYNTLTVPPRIAIAILTTYCLLVVGHILYSGITGDPNLRTSKCFPANPSLAILINDPSLSGISSNCWDTIAEVMALAINSTPTAALRNTCAGITELHIFKLPVRILVSKDEEGDGEHLELVFGQLNEDNAEQRTIQANRTYGTLPRTYTSEFK
ncbi:MAG: hypothetical protein Q9170_000598 [Blastenia crenularia]